MKCPRCTSTKLRKSMTSEDRLSSVVRFFVTPVRCYLCGCLFYRPTAFTDDLRREPAYPQYRRAA